MIFLSIFKSDLSKFIILLIINLKAIIIFAFMLKKKSLQIKYALSV